MSPIEEAGVTDGTKEVRMDSTKRPWRHLVGFAFRLTSPSTNAAKHREVDMESLLGTLHPACCTVSRLQRRIRRIREE
jgi:hypothetical protein